MALLFMDGFDHYATADMTKKWTTVNAMTINSTGGRRNGGYVATSLGTSAFGKTFPSSYSTIIVGFAFRYTGSSASLYDAIALKESTTSHLTLSVQPSSGKVTLRRGTNTGTLLATSTATLSASTWYYFELKATINDTTGAYDFRINGVTDFSATNVDTRNAGTSGVIDNITTLAGGSSITSSWDDLYVCDTSGSTNNNFLGDCRIDTLLPTGDGNYTQFTPSTGTSHYALVDESTPNTTDYNSSATSGNRDSYTYPDLTSLTSQTIYGVQICAAALKSDAGARSLGTMSRLSSTDKDGTGATLSTSQTYICEIQETDPSGSAWTQTNVNAAEFGVKVTA